MSDNYGNDPEKMLDWDKKLGEQSDYVKKAIEPLLLEKLHLDIFNTAKSNQYEVVDIFDELSEDGIFTGDEEPIVKILKPLGIEGCRHHDRVDIYDDEYLKELTTIHENYSKYNWKDVSKFIEISGLDEFVGDYLETNLYQENKNLSSYFIVGQPINSDSSNLSILFFQNGSDIEDHNPKFYVDLNSDIDSVKKIVENTVEHFNTLEYYSPVDMKEYIIQQLPEQAIAINEHPETSQTSDRQLETAQKTGYVQGVCESVLAFNTDENRKIMSESTMAFFSKKLLSEMNVTKDMAQKFAKPETFKALEQCVFAPKQEQHLEQTQSRRL